MTNRAALSPTHERATWRLPRPFHRLRVMRSALRLIEGIGCERTTNRGTYCWTREDWMPDCDYLADKWCDSCIAAAGLRGELVLRPKDCGDAICPCDRNRCPYLPVTNSEGGW